MRRIVIPKKEILNFVNAAEEGADGREIELAGDNFRVDITVLGKDEVVGHPELVGGTVCVFLNKYRRYIGHVVLTP